MNKIRAIQISLVLFIGAIALFGGVYHEKSSKLEATEPSTWGGYPYPYYRRHYYYHRYYPYFRYHVYPRQYYRLQVELTVKESPNPHGEKVMDVYIDGKRINIGAADSSGYRGTYYYTIGSGTHVVQWSVMENGQLKKYRRQFRVAPNDRYIEITIDGNRFSKQ